MFVLDSHCDTPSQILRLRDIALDNDHAHVDLPKLKRGGVDGAFFALYVPANLDVAQAEAYAWKLLDSLKASLAKNDNLARIAYSSADAYLNKNNEKFSVFIGLENGSPISDFQKLKEFYDAGVRYVTLCHSKDNSICDSCASKEKHWHGLSPFGIELVKKMNEIGMLIDVSHISDESFYDVLKYSSKPVVATHSCCRALADHPRNMTDDMIKSLAASGGVIQINYYPIFLSSDFSAVLESSGLEAEGEKIEADFIACPSDEKKRDAWYSILDKLERLPRPSYKRIVDHIDHVVSLVGIDHVGIGSDFDGICVTPEGMEDVSHMGKVFDEMRVRGYSEEDIKKVSGSNFLRVLDTVQGL